MPTKSGGYHTADGARVPSVTTVLHSWHPEGIEGLLGWANKLGREGKSHREERDKAADAGTMAHAAMEAWKHGLDYKFEGDADTCKKAEQAYGAFLEWADQTKLKILHAELPLVSERYKFGGTFDCILVNDRRSMGDYKTSNAIHAPYLAQIAAYAHLWNENYPDQPIEGGFHLLRFSRDHGDFSHHWWGELESAWQAFLRLRDLYEYAKELGKRAK